jgi:Ribosomal protein HS6-type (S12/L30/L7a)
MDIPQRKFYIGLKQSLKAIKNNEVKKVILAKDADGNVTDQVSSLCQEYQISLEYGEDRRILGKNYGVDIGTAVVAILK